MVNTMEMNDFDFLDYAQAKFTAEEWERLCDLLDDDGYFNSGWEN